MRFSLILRLVGIALLVTSIATVFSFATAEFMTNERKPMTTWQKIVKMTRIIVYDEGRYLRPDMPLKTLTIVVPRGSQGGEFVDVTPPERAGVFVFLVTAAVVLVLMLIGWVIGLLPRALMLTIVGLIGFLGSMYYLNQRPLIPLYMQMPDAAVYVIIYKTMFALALAFASGLFIALGRRAGPTPA
jgi:hypothetical protein